MKLVDRLAALGLAGRQAQLYLALLQRGPSSAIDLAKATRTKHPTVYTALDALKERRFVTDGAEGGRRIYTAEEPERLRRMEEERRRRIDDLLPDLQALYASGGRRPRVRLYPGDEGTAVIDEELLQVKTKEYFYFGNVRDMVAHGGEERLTEYYRRRIERGIWSNAIRVRGPEDALDFMQDGRRNLRRVRYLTDPIFDEVAGLYCYDGRVAVAGGLQENYVMIIESRELWVLMMAVWRVVWEHAEPPRRRTRRPPRRSREEA